MKLIFKKSVLDKVRELVNNAPPWTPIEAIELTEFERCAVERELRVMGIVYTSLTLFGHPVRNAE